MREKKFEDGLIVRELANGDIQFKKDKRIIQMDPMLLEAALAFIYEEENPDEWVYGCIEPTYLGLPYMAGGKWVDNHSGIRVYHSDSDYAKERRTVPVRVSRSHVVEKKAAHKDKYPGYYLKKGARLERV